MFKKQAQGQRKQFNEESTIEIDYITIGRRIKLYRKERGMTQEDLAESIDVSDQYISLIENGRKKPSLQILVKIADTLGITINDLVYRSNVSIKEGSGEIDRKIALFSDEKSELIMQHISGILRAFLSG